MLVDHDLEVYEDYLIKKHLHSKKSKLSFINFKKLIVWIILIICLIVIFLPSITVDDLSYILGVIITMCIYHLFIIK